MSKTTDFLYQIETSDIEISFDIRHRSIIDALPAYGNISTVLDVGCGHGAVPRTLQKQGYKVTGLDIERRSSWVDPQGVNFIEEDFMTSSALESSYDVVICSEVIEHLPNYKSFYAKLLSMATERLIVTVPYERSFDMSGPPPVGHCNYWSMGSTPGFLSAGEFITMSRPYSTSISKIRSKPRDVQMRQWCLMIVVDKRQSYG